LKVNIRDFLIACCDAYGLKDKAVVGMGNAICLIYWEIRILLIISLDTSFDECNNYLFQTSKIEQELLINQ